MITKEALHKKSSQELTALLYEACLDHLETAKEAITQKDYVVVNEKLQKAIDILHRLGAGINYEAGIVADQLDALYNYMADRLVVANYEKSIEIIDEVIKPLEELAVAWQKAMVTNSDAQSKSLKRQASAYEQSMMYE
ncbi:flagellar export chaperone FliS [Paenalkalicoccus suaedae]|uniref:Flagellar secretion chaperone FliS n=1 Tax=Paenalkalicoccus suaedae TaxID=2592382 RepID=A0A859FEI3_9BACI|nr:flagellar export chaperone FliS [Paenalkalicoccus suaedae]QKS70994.1 flagellar export chaperone FliS [Paenalkalicoccus suaedae]